MTSPHPGVPASELTDEDLERQGIRAHATRHWVFLHGTAEQFRTHTTRMLELEQEYLRRHPQRTWQGSGRTDAGATDAQLRDARIRDLVRTLGAEVFSLLDETAAPTIEAPVADPADGQTRLLAAFADAPGGRLHKLEAHQIARSVATTPHLVATLYQHDPPLLAVDGDMRVLTDAGRSWLAARATAPGKL